MLLPIIVSLVLLGLAYLIFYMLPEIIDYETSFLWVVGGFLAVYILAAIFLSYKLPAVSSL